MEPEHIKAMDAHVKPAAGADSPGERLSQAATKLWQCKDGSLVRNPLDCTKTIGELPKLTIG